MSHIIILEAVSRNQLQIAVMLWRQFFCELFICYLPYIILTQIYRYNFCTSWQEQNFYFTVLLWAWKHASAVHLAFLKSYAGSQQGRCSAFKYVLRSGRYRAVIQGFHMHINWKNRREVLTWPASFLLVSCKWMILHYIYRATFCRWCSHNTHLTAICQNMKRAWNMILYHIQNHTFLLLVCCEIQFNFIYFCS